MGGGRKRKKNKIPGETLYQLLFIIPWWKTETLTREVWLVPSAAQISQFILNRTSLSKDSFFSNKGMHILEQGEPFWTFICNYSPKFARPAALNEKELTSHSRGLEPALAWLTCGTAAQLCHVPLHARSAFPVLQPPGFAPQQSDWIRNGVKCCCWSYQNRSETNKTKT